MPSCGLPGSPGALLHGCWRARAAFLGWAAHTRRGRGDTTGPAGVIEGARAELDVTMLCARDCGDGSHLS